MKRIGLLQQRLLLLLLASGALAFTKSPSKQIKILKSFGEEWKKTKEANLARAIKALYQNHMISLREEGDGSTVMLLSEDGKQRALQFKLEEMEIKRPLRWDGYWRMTMFDVPEKQKRTRDAFRYHLKRLGFHELQKSVFIHPFDCKDQVDFLIEFYSARRFIRFILVKELDNALHMRKLFKV